MNEAWGLKMMNETFKHTIDDLNAPKRLYGLVVTAKLYETPNGARLEFMVDMPDEPTGQEIGYMKWFLGEIVDKLKDLAPPGISFGEAKYANEIY